MKIIKEFIFPASSLGECHASTIENLPNGNCVAAWFAGIKEGTPDVSIWTARRSVSGWEAPRKLPRIREAAHWNPVLFLTGRKLHLFYKIGETIPQWQTWHTVSIDGGTTWTTPEELVAGDHGGRGPVKNKPIITADKSWFAPGSHEPDGRWISFVDYSRDSGKSWTISMVPMDWSLFTNDGSRGVIQPTLWESAPGKLHMLLRSSAGKIFRSDSADNGVSWNAAYPTNLPNNNSGIDLAQDAEGTLALLCNPILKNWGPRSPLSLFFSRDNGISWEKGGDLETEEGEFSYPAIIPVGNGEFLASYTWKRKTISFARVSL